MLWSLPWLRASEELSPLKICETNQLLHCPTHIFQAQLRQSPHASCSPSPFTCATQPAVRLSVSSCVRSLRSCSSSKSRSRKSLFTHAAGAASSVWDLDMTALTILTDFCLSVSEGDGLADVVMFAPSLWPTKVCALVRLAKAKASAVVVHGPICFHEQLRIQERRVCKS